LPIYERFLCSSVWISMVKVFMFDLKTSSISAQARVESINSFGLLNLKFNLRLQFKHSAFVYGVLKRECLRETIEYHQ